VIVRKAPGGAAGAQSCCTDPDGRNDGHGNDAYDETQRTGQERFPPSRCLGRTLRFENGVIGSYPAKFFAE
jgi:hypothetical protein